MAQEVGHWPVTMGAQFDPRPVCMGFVMDKVAVGQVLLCVLHLSLVTFIPPMLHIHSLIMSIV